jgi:all-trans-retinol 13,14-reductase
MLSRQGSSHSMVHYDCIVIGAGMSGLTFAGLAALSGKKVLVVDQHYLPGGNFTAFKNGRFTFNVALEWTTDCGPGQKLNRLLSRLGLQDAYPFVRIDKFKTIISSHLVVAPTISVGTENFRRNLCEAFPNQRDAIQRFTNDCLEVMTQSAAASAITLKHGTKPVEKMLTEYFDDPLLVHLFYSLIAYPGARGVLLMFMVGAICLDQMWRPVHGDHRKLSSLLYRKILAGGGEVLLSMVVQRILLENNAAIGVQLSDGRCVYSTDVIATTDPRQLYEKLLPPDLPLPLATQRMLNRPPSLSCFCVFLGLNQSVKGLSSGSCAYSLLADHYDPSCHALDLTHIPLRVEIQTEHYPKLAPPGHATLCIWAALPISAFNFWGQGAEENGITDKVAYDRVKAAATELILCRLENAFPGLRSTIVLMDGATPFTFKHYNYASAGAVSGYCLSNMNYLKSLPSATHINHLHHIGHWTTQSGVNMAMYSGEALHASLYGEVNL